MTSQKIVGPLVLATVLATGIATAWGVIAVWSIAMVDQTRRSERLTHGITVRADGTPLIQHGRFIRGPVSDYRVEYFSLDGDPVDASDVRGIYGASLRMKERQDPTGRPPWSQRVLQFHPGHDPTASEHPAIWYFIHDGRNDGRGYFVGYELEGNRCVGYLGTSGFSREKPSRESWFRVSRKEFAYRSVILSEVYSTVHGQLIYGGNNRGPIYMRSGDKILAIDLWERSVRTLYEDSSILQLARLAYVTEPTEDNGWKGESAIAVRMPDKIAVISLDGELVAEFALTKSIRGDRIQFFLLPNKQGLFVGEQTDSASELVSATLTWIDQGGTMLDQRNVTLGQTDPELSMVARLAIGASAFPAPGIMVPGIALMAAPWMEQEKHPQMNYWQAVGSVSSQIWPIVFGLLAFGAVLSWLCVRRQRKYALAWTRTWAVFVFLFGISGYLAYLCHRRWPVREECGECQQAAPRDRESCAFCDTLFPAPEPKGVEIFV
jgi:hypothetical protein